MSGLLELRKISAGYDNRRGYSVSSGYENRRGIIRKHDFTSGRGYPGKLVISNIDLSVREGEILALAGPNGSGKTTLLKIAGGILAPFEGSVTINGKEIGRLKKRERAALAAFLFQKIGRASCRERV